MIGPRATLQTPNVKKNGRGRRHLNNGVLVPDVGEALWFRFPRVERHQLCERPRSLRPGISPTNIAPAVEYVDMRTENVFFPEFQEISVRLQADEGVEERNADDCSGTMVAPPHQEAVVRGAGVVGLHHGVDALVSKHHQNRQTGHLDVILQTKETESTFLTNI